MACILNISPQLWKAAPGCFVVTSVSWTAGCWEKITVWSVVSQTGPQLRHTRSRPCHYGWSKTDHFSFLFFFYSDLDEKWFMADHSSGWLTEALKSARGFLPKIPGVITGWTCSICITISVRLRLQSASHGESIRLHTSSFTYPSTLILSWITDVTQTSFLGEKEKKSPSPQRNCPAKRNQIPTKFHHFHHSTLFLEDLQKMPINRVFIGVC